MTLTAPIRSAIRWSAAGIGVAAGSYAAYVGCTWLRYGHQAHAASAAERDELLDRFVPVYETCERHHVRISAPAALTLEAAKEVDLLHAPIVRVLIRGRELILGATPDDRPRPRGLLAEVQALGWGVLAEIPGREIVVGAVTQPWEARVVFRPLPPDQFAGFAEAGYVKIAWTLRADPIGETESVFRTETRVVSTDPAARARFRRYWSLFSPGIILIRWASLAPLKREAERRARDSRLRRHATPAESLH